MLCLRCLGTFDVKSVLRNTKRPSYYIQYEGPEWIKFNYDTGAATTAPPVELLEGPPLRKVVESIVANGQDITNIVRAKFQTVEEFGKKRKMEGHVTEVHEPLASASEISMYNDSFIFEKFGALILQTQPSCRRSTTRVSSTVSTSLLS